LKKPNHHKETKNNIFTSPRNW